MAVSIQGIYIALFGRPADPLGLKFFNEATRIGEDLTAVGDLATTAEYQERFLDLRDDQIVTSIYQCLFGRDPEPEGLAFYAKLLASGEVSLKWIAIHIMSGAQGEDLAVLENKIAAANMFTASFFTQAEIDAYMSNGAAEIGRKFIESISSDPATLPSQTQIDSLIQLLLKPDEATPPPADTIDPGWPSEPSLPQPPVIFNVEDDGYVQGTTRAFLLITLYVDGIEVGQTRADGDGIWSFYLSLDKGNYILTATAADPAGNISDPSAEFEFIAETGGLQQELRIDMAGDIYLISVSGEMKDGVLVNIETISDFTSGKDVIEFQVEGEPPSTVPVSVLILLEGLEAGVIENKSTLEDAVSFALMHIIEGAGEHVAFGYGGEQYLLFSGDGDSSFDAGVDHIVILGTDPSFANLF